MSRRAEMNHVVYSGWMVKSPPEKKLTGPWKIFRARWKRRYFVLSKPAQSLPGAYHLKYFGDETCKRVKGCIDLEQCLEIIESLDSEHYRYLLAIKTTHKGRQRTYFLATETEEQMSTWVRNLCSVCGMKRDDSPERPQPPSRETVNRSPPTAVPTPGPRPVKRNSPQMGRSPPAHSTPHRHSPSTRNKPKPVTTQPRQAHVAPTSTVNENSEEYIPLVTCTSGNSVKGPTPGRQTSVDSVPEEPAPPPPIKMAPHDMDNDVFGETNYDVPPRTRMEVDNIYKVPPPSGPMEEEDFYKVPPGHDDVYKVPPPRPPPSKATLDNSPLDNYDVLPPRHSPMTPRSSSSESQKADSVCSQGMTYDFPPSRDDEIYDVPPSHCQTINDDVSVDSTPPGRPPKPSHLAAPADGQDAYMNIPPNSKMFTNLNQGVALNSVLPLSSVSPEADLYDIPRGDADTKITNNNDTKETILAAQPPPPSMCGPKEHKYINAYHGFVDDQQDVYIPMDPVGKQSNVPAHETRKSSSTDTSNEVEYTDMSGRAAADDSRESKPIYDHITTQPRPVNLAPPRPIKVAVVGSEHGETSISITARTRSFKRCKNSTSSPIMKPRAATRNEKVVVLPQRSDRHPDFSTSDEDDDEVLGSPLWGTTPPAPVNKDTELKYVDLEHDESLDKEPLRSPHGNTSAITPTEYHEIDFLKTDALRSAKEQTIEERCKKMVVE